MVAAPVTVEVEEGATGEHEGMDPPPPSTDLNAESAKVAPSPPTTSNSDAVAHAAANQLYQALNLSQNTVALLQAEVARLHALLMNNRAVATTPCMLTPSSSRSSSDSFVLDHLPSVLDHPALDRPMSPLANQSPESMERAQGMVPLDKAQAADSLTSSSLSTTSSPFAPPPPSPRLEPASRSLWSAFLLPMRCVVPFWRFSDERLEARFLEHLAPTQRRMGSISLVVILLSIALQILFGNCSCLTLYTKGTRDELPHQEEARRICSAVAYANLAATLGLGCLHAVTCLPRFRVRFVAREKLLMLFLALQFVAQPFESSFRTAALAGPAPDRSVVYDGLEESSDSRKGLLVTAALTCIAHCGLLVRARNSWMLTVLATASVGLTEYLMMFGASELSTFNRVFRRKCNFLFVAMALLLRACHVMLEGAMRNAFKARHDLERKNASLAEACSQAKLLSDSLVAANREITRAQQDAVERAAAEVGKEKQLRDKMVRRLVSLERQSQRLSTLLREEQSAGACAPAALSTRS